MFYKIAHRDGFGAVLAEGSTRASRSIGRGSERYVRALKGMDFVEDPRAMKWENQLSFLTNPRGGDDLKATHGLADFPGLPGWAGELNWSEEEYLKWLLDRLDMFDDVKRKIFGVPPRLKDLDGPMLTKWYNDLTCVFNSLGLCLFSGTTVEAFGPSYYAALFSACTGFSVTPPELMKSGERIFNVMKAYNVREGMRREHDHWPSRFYEERLPDSGSEIRTSKGSGVLSALSKEKIDRLLDEYYELRGWNKRTGIPTRETLEDLQLDNVADELLK
jgi:aldehyde:ferredoxin oxidoreductase